MKFFWTKTLVKNNRTPREKKSSKKIQQKKFQQKNRTPREKSFSKNYRIPARKIFSKQNRTPRKKNTTLRKKIEKKISQKSGTFTKTKKIIWGLCCSASNWLSAALMRACFSSAYIWGCIFYVLIILSPLHLFLDPNSRSTLILIT
jgi:hypothetical protein